MNFMNAIALFLISVMDSGSAESTQTLTVTLSSKIISSSHLQHALQGKFTNLLSLGSVTLLSLLGFEPQPSGL